MLFASGPAPTKPHLYCVDANALCVVIYQFFASSCHLLPSATVKVSVPIYYCSVAIAEAITNIIKY